MLIRRPFEAITTLAKKISSNCDPHVLAVSMIGLVLFHFESAPIRGFLPGGQSKHNDFDVITNHVTQLLSTAFDAAKS